MIEEWRPIEGWLEYSVSNYGQVRRVAPSNHHWARVGELRKLGKTPPGYPYVTLTAPGRRKLLLVHRLVAIAFLGPPPEPKMEVNHKDSNRANPRADNLEWVTRGNNHRHAYQSGFASAKGSRNGYSKLTEDRVRQIRANATADPFELAAEHGVSAATIKDVLSNRTWNHV